MTEPHRPESGWPGPIPPAYPGHVDPAYAEQTPYQAPYHSPYQPAPTRQFPTEPGYDPYATTWHGAPQPAPPEGPPPGGSRRWLWVLAGASVLVVVGLLVALVVVNSSDQQTVVAPAPTAGPSFTTRTAPPTTTRRPTSTSSPTLPFPVPGPTTSGTPGQPTVPGETEPVAYSVEGSGRAMSITYVDSGGVLQTEFNVPLPWTRQVELAKPANSSASVTIINFGREVTCSVTITNVVVERRTGSGLTICAAIG